ncbi:MAG: glycosyltransferase family 39 protein [Myxococcales bacterium]|nr:glycosyltransferase family 39 protein [Myxococcales bacterium]
MLESLTRPRIFAAILLVLTGIESWWYAPYGLGGSDEGALLATAGRIMRGDVFYQDLDAYPFPGAPYLLALVMGLFGEHVSVARFLAGVFYSGIVVTLYAVALQLISRERAALFGISLLGFKFLAWPAYTSYFYWDVSFFAASIAVLLLLYSTDQRTRGPLIGIGAAVGVAFITKQSIGIYLGIAIAAVLSFDHFMKRGEGGSESSLPRQWGHLALGFSLAAGPLILYFAVKGLLPHMISSGLIRPFTDYAETSGISFGTPLRWWELGDLQGPQLFFYYPVSYWTVMRNGVLPGGEAAYAAYWAAGEVFIRWIYTSLPLAFAAAGAFCLRDRSRLSLPAERRFATFVLLCAAITLSAFPRSDFTHLMGIYPMVLLLMFICFGRLTGLDKEESGKLVPRTFEAVTVAIIAMLFLGLGAARHRGMTARIDLPRANLKVFPSSSYHASIVRFVTDEVPEEAPFFVYGHEAFYYFLSGRYSSWSFLQLYPGQAGGDNGVALTEYLKRDPPPYIIQGFLNFPGIPRLPSYTGVLFDHLRASYREDTRVFERYPPASSNSPGHHWIQVLRLKSDTDLE